MKHLKSLVLAKSIAAAIVASAGIAAPVAAHASEQDGVTCEAGTEATLVNGVLKCKKRKVLASICSPIAFGTALRINTNIVMDPIGRDGKGTDQCLAVGTGALVDSVMQPPTPGIDPPVSAFHRVPNPTGPDTFVAEFYVYPTGPGAIYPPAPPVDASRGVACPSGFTAVGINNNRGLRCETTLVKAATCDTLSPYQIKHIAGRDQCVFTVRDLFGNPIAEVTGEYTIPSGVNYLGITGDPEKHGWNLDTDRVGNADYWVSEQKTFKFPAVL
jgi:hypothetical protein